MQNKHQAGFADQVSIEQIRNETDALIAGIIRKTLTRASSRRRFAAVAERVLTDTGGKGRLATWCERKLLGFFLRRFQPDHKTVKTSESVAAEIGRLLTLRLVIQNHPQRQRTPAENQAAAENAAGIIDDFISQLDFGELYEAIAASGPSIQLTADRVREMLVDEHTGKLAAMAPSIVEIINIVVRLNRMMLAENQDLPPDFVADFTAGLINLVDGKAVGEMINQGNEFIRLVNIGNHLQKEGGTTLFQTAAHHKLNEIIREIDPDGYLKMKQGRAELSEAFQQGMLKSLQTSPRLVKKMMEARALVHNAGTRLIKEKISLLSSLPDDEFSESVTQFFNRLEQDEISDTINRFLVLAGKIQQQQPGLIGAVLSDICSCLDQDELEAVSGPLMEELLTGIAPVASALMPRLIDGVSDLLADSLAENPDELSPRLARLFSILKNGREEQ